jgi:hypothetical protein
MRAQQTMLARSGRRFAKYALVDFGGYWLTPARFQFPLSCHAFGVQLIGTRPAEKSAEHMHQVIQPVAQQSDDGGSQNAVKVSLSVSI